MKFKAGDKVKVIGGVYFIGKAGEITRIKPENTNPYLVIFGLGSDDWAWKAESQLELVSQQAEPQAVSVEYLEGVRVSNTPQAASVELPTIRAFETGATRDTVVGKLSYMKALSPEVLEAYVTYLSEHRKQSDGSMREFDNWKKGIDKWTYLDSLLRHDKAVWMLMLGYEVSDNHGPVTLLASLMAVIFNASGLAYELLIEEGRAKRCVQSS